MSRDKNYQRMLNSKRWRQLRMWKLEHDPLCQLCKAEGYVRSAVDVHHILPVEGVKDLAEMEARCFDTNNLQSLCIPCHIKVHQEQGSHTKEAHQQRQAEALSRWVSKHKT